MNQDIPIANEKHLLNHLKKGNAAVFKAIFDQYWDKIYAFCLKQTCSTEIAQELTQNIFHSLWERREQLDIKVSLQHYLFRAAKYQIINNYRNENSRLRALDCFYAEFCGADNCTEDHVNYNQLKDTLNTLIDQLPCQCKEVFLLRKDNDMSYRQIAQNLNISVKTVEYHLTNARRHLKTGLKDFL